jgi:hypothetical protein
MVDPGMVRVDLGASRRTSSRTSTPSLAAGSRVVLQPIWSNLTPIHRTRDHSLGPAI